MYFVGMLYFSQSYTYRWALSITFLYLIQDAAL